MAKTKAKAEPSPVRESEGSEYDKAESQTAAILAIYRDLSEGEASGKVTSTDVAEVFAKTTFAKGRDMAKLKALCSSTMSLHKSKSRPEQAEPRQTRSETAARQPLTLDSLIQIKRAMKETQGLESVIESVTRLARQVGGLDRLAEGIEALKQLRD